jgi:hypothetical protein
MGPGARESGEPGWPPSRYWVELVRKTICGRFITVLAALTFLWPGSMRAQERQEQTYAPQLYPKLEISRAPGEIKIDGELNDAGWQDALPATHFTEHSPGEEVEPPVRTKAFVTFDDKHLYIAAICYAEPGTVRASVCEREQIFNDDNIGFFFDTYGDASSAYIINLNPYGIPYDALWSPGWGEDGNFDLLFESSGKITDSGYQVEAAIPFRSLRFPSRDVQEWRFDFYRHHLREAHYSMSWARYDQNESCWPCRWGTVTGIEGVTPGRGLELIGSVVSTQVGTVVDHDRPTSSFTNNDVMTEMSVGGRFAPTSDVAFEATVNPDFSQIESDASQVDVNTTFALSFPERRPFFQEGVDAFRTNFNVVYTRSINDPDLAAKGSAKLGPTSVSVLSARDVRSPVIVPFEERSEFVARGESVNNLVALRQALGRDNHLRAIATDRRFDGGGSGTLASFDAAVRLTRSIKLRGQFIYTHTQEPDKPALTDHFDTLQTHFDNGKYTTIYDGESFSGTGLLTGINYEGRRAFLDFVMYQRTPTYRADNGFQPRNNDRQVQASGNYRFRPQGRWVTEVQPGIEAARIYNFDGIRKDQWVSAWTWVSFPVAQTSVSSNVLFSQERFGGKDFDDIWSVSGSFNSRPGDVAGFGADFNYGNRIARSFLLMGRETNLSGWIDFRPLKRLQGEWSASFSRSRDLQTGEEFFAGYITRLRLSYQFTRRFSLRLVGEYDEFSQRWSIDPLLTYRINPFSVFFIGSTYDYLRFEDRGPPTGGPVTSLEARQFFVKLQYLFMT